MEGDGIANVSTELNADFYPRPHMEGDSKTML